VALFLGDGAPPEEIVKRADSAMYRAKEAGGNQVCYFEP
jgi:GGDEF domain-containing protein